MKKTAAWLAKKNVNENFKKMEPHGFHVENFQIFLARIFYFPGATKGKRVATKKINKSKRPTRTKLFGWSFSKWLADEKIRWTNQPHVQAKSQKNHLKSSKSTETVPSPTKKTQTWNNLSPNKKISQKSHHKIDGCVQPQSNGESSQLWWNMATHGTIYPWSFNSKKWL